MANIPQFPKITTGTFNFKKGVVLADGTAAEPKAKMGWEPWLKTLFPQYVTSPFAQRHIDLWSWIDSIEPQARPTPFIAIWPRGGAKSTTAELATVRLAYRKARRYCWYISGTQQKADLHVASIASMLESKSLGLHFPELSSRLFGKFGNIKGWRRNRLRTASGFTVDALGLDTGLRGGKIDELRPDLIILDDVDDLHDSLVLVAKKIETLTKTILPAGSTNCAILFVQNLIHQDSVANQLVTGRADFLTERILSGPHKAVEGLVVDNQNGRYKILAGAATWEGQNLDICQAQIQNWGLSAFMGESQQDVDKSGGIWESVIFQHIQRESIPALEDICVWIDPAVTSTDRSDCQGLCAAGRTYGGEVIFLDGWEGIMSPEEIMERAIILCFKLGASHLGVETDQGGDTWEIVFKAALKKILESSPRYLWSTPPTFTSDKAGAGHGSKVARNALMLSDYERGNVYHVQGKHAALEAALYRFPRAPLDLADAMYWAWQDLYEGNHAEIATSGMEGYRG